MFYQRTIKVLAYFFLLVTLCTGQVSAAPDSNVKVSSLSKSSTILPVEVSLKYANNQPSGSGTNFFTGTATVNEKIVFSTIDSMHAERSNHTATLLKNGKVLITGGKNFGGNIQFSSAEIFDPNTDMWTTIGNMMDNKYNHTATLLNNDKVLVVGFASTSEVYDPVANTWTSTGTMISPRIHHTATLLNDGRVLVVGGGGSGTTSAEVYDPSTNTWTNTGSMSIARTGHSATLLNSGKVLVMGGQNGVTIRLSSAEIYNPATNTWAITGSMNSIRAFHSAVLLTSGKVLVMGGVNSGGSFLSSAELYDPSAGIWANTGSMSMSRYTPPALLLSNGKVLVDGGYYGNNSVDLYDPSTEIWVSPGNMNKARIGHTSTLLKNGKLLVAGGENGTSAEIGTLIPSNTLTSTLTLPSKWSNNTTISIKFKGNSTGAAIDAGSISNDNATWGNWIPANPDTTITSLWNVGADGANKPIYLRLRDVNGRVATVVRGTNNKDATFLSEDHVFDHNPSTLSFQFGENVLSDSSIFSATTARNYMLLRSGANDDFHTSDISAAICDPAHVPEGDDENIPLYNITYDSSTYIATLAINPNYAPLRNGKYRLYVCGAASIHNLASNPINGGKNITINFSVEATTINFNVEAAADEPHSKKLPKTGFAPDLVTLLPKQPENAAYTKMSGLWLEIPSQKVKANIVGVPEASNDWDVTWLGKSAGWLNGTAYPTWEGNSVITAHVTDANGLSGPFANIKNLVYGNQIVVHQYGEKYTFEVRETKMVSPDSTSYALKHLEGHSYLTLITCQGYNFFDGSYIFRRVVRAVLVKVEAE